MMTTSRRAFAALAALGLLAPAAMAYLPPHWKLEPRLPLSQLAPGKPHPGLCLLSYRVSTSSRECQEFFDQGLAYYYSYVYLEAVRSFETATRHDPECAMAWLGLSRAFEKYRKQDLSNQALKKAKELQAKASHREGLLIKARLQEKGMADGVGPADRKKAAARTIDELLTLYDDDEEGWFTRAQLTEGGTAAVPYYKALLRVNPLHPGANHELVHFYEGFQRPALGWVNAENYIKSSPGIPHPFHMQAHLATRLGRWDKTSDRSSRAIELERAYHDELGVKASDDEQFSHHLEILTRSLIHDGRFREAHAVREEAYKAGQRTWQVWFSLALAERDWEEALRMADEFRKSDKVTAAYLRALVYLGKDDPERATPEVEVVQHAYAESRSNKPLEFRLWEVQGLLACQTGDIDAGLKLLARAVERSKNDYGHHSWGNGAYYMEKWGVAALAAHRHDVAEEAFLEALAHDPGSVRAALGLQVLCERLGRADEAQRYAGLAHRSWKRAESVSLTAELTALRQSERTVHTHATATAAPGSNLK